MKAYRALTNTFYYDINGLLMANMATSFSLAAKIYQALL